MSDISVKKITKSLNNLLSIIITNAFSLKHKTVYYNK